MMKISRFFKRGNLQSARRRSASCPNLEQVSSRDTFIDGAKDGLNADSSSDSEPDVKEKPSKLERLHAQRSIRKIRQKEKEKTENSLKNLLSMDDYLSKLSELKTWLREEKHKEPDTMQSPKLKVHFKTFIRLWNKRKLPAKYYRTCSVDLEAADCTLDLDTEALQDTATPRYPLLDKPKIMSPAFLAQIVDLSPGNALDVGDGKNVGLNNAADSPFSTFGKACEYDAETIISYSAPKNETENSISNQQNILAEKQGLGTKQGAHYDYPSRTSPSKFATISRSTPTRNTLRSSPSPVSRLMSSARLCRVASPQCPPIISPGKFSMRPLPETPTGTKVSLPQPSQEKHQDVSLTDRENLVAGWNLTTEQSPVYSCIKDAIPYSSGSPKYAEIDESGSPQIISARDVSNRVENKLVASSSQMVDGDYCSLSLQPENHALSSSKKAVVRKPSLNRRRSKSMEDIYSMPFRAVPLSERKLSFLNEESSCEDRTEPPPIPDRNFSPQSLFHSFISSRDKKVTPQKSMINPGGVKESSFVVPSKTSQNGKKESPQKRRSHENSETSIKTSPPKKVRSESPVKDEMSKDDSFHGNISGSTNAAQQTLVEKCEPETPTPLSILTGSLKPTTRSAQRAASRSNLLDCSSKTNPGPEEKEKSRLEVLEVKELEESPKFPRRKLKRRSSSFSITPGKGLTFGKSTKLTTPSPRRVSFAKEVKDTESKSSPRRRSSTRKNIAPAGGFNVTRQTQESRNFQSFLSSHTSPTKGKVFSQEESAIKPPSPIKTSLTNLLGNLKKKAESNTAEPFVASPNVGTKSSEERTRIALRRSPVKREPSVQDLEASGDIFPPSSTRQVGRRILGSPIKQSPNTSQSNQLPKFPIGNKSTKLRDSTTSLIPKKPINVLVAKLSNKTSFLCSEEVGDSDDCSSNDELLDQKLKSESDAGNFEGSCEGLNNQQGSNGTEDNPANSQLKITSPRTFTDDPVLRFDMSPENQEEFMPHVKVDHGFEDQSRAGDVKAFARVTKIWNRTVGFDASIDPFMRKTRSTSQVTGKTSHNHNASVRSKGFFSKTGTRMTMQRTASEKEVQKAQVVKEFSNIGIDDSTCSSVLKQASNKAHQVSFNNCNTQIQSQPQFEEENSSKDVDFTGSESNTSLDFTLPPYPESEREEEMEQSVADLPCSLPPIETELSFALPPYPEIAADDASFIETISEAPCPAPRSRRRRSSFPLPPCPEELKLMTDGNIWQSDQTGSVSSKSTVLSETDPSCLPPISTSSNNDFEKVSIISSSLPPNSEEPPSSVGKENALTAITSLRKIESLRKASPKVVENDSWITERRRSNRSSKGQRSFRSELNQSSTKDLSNMEAPSCTLNHRSQESSDSFHNLHNREDSSSTSHVSSDESQSTPVKFFLNPQAPLTDSTPSQRKPITKPATLPKTSRAMNLSQKRLNVQNFMGTSNAPNRPVAKRRSSLTKGQPNKTSSKQDFITRNINAVKKEAKKTSGVSFSASTTSRITHTEKTSCNIARADGNEETDCTDQKSKLASENSPDTQRYTPSKISVITHVIKVSSTTKNIVNTENRRRRSRSCGVDEENKMSFSERRKFFQQLQGKKLESKQKSNSPLTLPNKFSVLGSKDNTESLSTPRSMRSQYKTVSSS